MRSKIEMVEEFRRAAGFYCGGPRTPPDKEIQLYSDLLLEELREFQEAADKLALIARIPADRRLVQLSDARREMLAAVARELADIEYLLYGISMQWGKREFSREVSPHINQRTHRFNWEVSLTAFLSRVMISQHSDYDRQVAIGVVHGAAGFYDIPLDAVFAEVHRANMDKVKCGICEGAGGFWGESRSTLDDTYACSVCGGSGSGPEFDENGKLAKPEGWRPPDVVGILRLQESPGGRS